ncbi:hypothetical protein GCM10027199_33020 [Amycolatopsis magusensis]
MLVGGGGGAAGVPSGAPQAARLHRTRAAAPSRTSFRMHLSYAPGPGRVPIWQLQAARIRRIPRFHRDFIASEQAGANCIGEEPE